MFTSRAEYRLLLREDNADARLTEQGRKLGLVDDERWAAFSLKQEAIARETERMAKTWIQPKSEQAAQLAVKLSQPLSKEANLRDLLKRPQLVYADLESVSPSDEELDDAVKEQVEISAKYEGYIQRQQDEIESLRRHENMALPADFDYDVIGGLSNEVKQKLKQSRPETLAQASRISGVTPAAVSMLLIHLKKQSLSGQTNVKHSA